MRIKKFEFQKISYSKFIKSFENENKELFKLLHEDDSFYSKLGSTLMDVLRFSNLIDIKVTTLSIKEKRHDYFVKDKNLLSKKHTIKVTPLNLPMILPPKDYTINALGGYLLNDDIYKLDIMSKKANMRYSSTITENNNKLYYLLNNTSKVPFKVNKELLGLLYTNLGTKLLLQK